MLWDSFNLGKLPYGHHLHHVILPGSKLLCLQPFTVSLTNLLPGWEGPMLCAHVAGRGHRQTS